MTEEELNACIRRIQRTQRRELFVEAVFAGSVFLWTFTACVFTAFGLPGS